MGGEGRARRGVGDAGGAAARSADVAAVAGNKVVTLSWSPSEGAVGYNVYRGTLHEKAGVVAIAQGLAGLAFVDTTVANGPTYFYKVTALNAGGESPRSPKPTRARGAAPAVDENDAARVPLPAPGHVGSAARRRRCARERNGVDAFLDEQFARRRRSIPTRSSTCRSR